MIELVLYVAVLGLAACTGLAFVVGPGGRFLLLPPMTASAGAAAWCLVVLYARSQRRKRESTSLR